MPPFNFSTPSPIVDFEKNSTSWSVLHRRATPEVHPKTIARFSGLLLDRARRVDEATPSPRRIPGRALTPAAARPALIGQELRVTLPHPSTQRPVATDRAPGASTGTSIAFVLAILNSSSSQQALITTRLPTTELRSAIVRCISSRLTATSIPAPFPHLHPTLRSLADVRPTTESFRVAVFTSVKAM